MLRMGKKTTYSPDEVLVKAKEFFGPGGTGLEIVPRGSSAVQFTGGGGFVLVQVGPAGEGTEIDIQSREWDYDVKRFLRDM